MADTFTFELVSPERLLVSEPAREVQVPGRDGDFTVLPLHAPMLSTLRPGVISIKLEDGATRRVFVRSGLAEVDSEHLTILAQRLIDLDAIDRDELAQEVRNAEEDLSDATTDDAKRDAQAALERLQEVQSAL